MKMHLAMGFAALISVSPGFADTCAPIMKAAGAYAKAERYTVKMTMVSKGETHNTEVMMAPEGMYIKAGDQWIRSPVAINRQELLDSNKSVFSDCKRIGKEDVDGAPTVIYQFTGKAEGEAPMAGKMWIGTADDLPRRMQGRTKDADITQVIRYVVPAPKGSALALPGLNQLKGLFK
jgi:outer membrane lipoprotein-sorting protein